MIPKDRTFILSGGASGLTLSATRDLHSAGAYVSILDLNAETGSAIAKELGERARFFETDVADTESIEKAIQGTVDWVKDTGKEIGGVVAGAGVGLPGLVSLSYESSDDRHIGGVSS